jgi:hypothetical protein
LELFGGAGDFRFLLSVFFRAVDNFETPNQASQNIYPPCGVADQPPGYFQYGCRKMNF